MKKILLGLAVLFLLVIGVLIFVAQPIVFRPATRVVPAIDEEHLRTYVVALAERFSKRNQADNLQQASSYIADELAAAGGQMGQQIFEVEGHKYRNVIATFGPAGQDRIVVGAHYDAFEGLPGADDNASGVAGLLALATLLGKTRLPVQVDLVAYTLEEPPYFRSASMGSMQHARFLKEQKAKLRAMLCLEMIGYFSDSDGSQRFPIPGLSLIYGKRGDFITVAGRFADAGLTRKVKRAMTSANDLPVHSMNAMASIPGIDFSDHLSYWQQGYPAVMITDTAFYRNPNYHTAADLPETLDYGRMAQVVQQVYAAVLDLAKAD